MYVYIHFTHTHTHTHTHTRTHARTHARTRAHARTHARTRVFLTVNVRSCRHCVVKPLQRIVTRALSSEGLRSPMCLVVLSPILLTSTCHRLRQSRLRQLKKPHDNDMIAPWKETLHTKHRNVHSRFLLT